MIKRFVNLARIDTVARLALRFNQLFTRKETKTMELSADRLRRIGLSDEEIAVIELWQRNPGYRRFKLQSCGPIIKESIEKLLALLYSQTDVTPELRTEAGRLSFILGPEGYTLTGSACAHCGKMPA